MNKIFLGAIALTSLVLGACSGPPSSDQVQHQQQETLAQESNMQVGMPAIVNFFEKRQLKQIYEMRDDPHYSTHTYIADLNGHLHKICDSIGYGIPSATQYTNPQRVARYGETPSTGNVTLPQADPNGLFSPTEAEATWILCVDPGEKNPARAVKPLYVEPRVLVSPFELNHVD